MRVALVFATSIGIAVAGLAVRAVVDRTDARGAKGVQVANAATLPGYDEAVADLVQRRRLAEVLADAAPGSWTRRAQAASYELGYAQLTGDYDGYAAATHSLDEAFRVARSSIDDETVGPNLLKAQVDYELHRFAPALESLRAPEKEAAFFHDAKRLAGIASLRGALTFGLGQYEDGLALLREAVDLDPTPTHQQRLALALAKVGDIDEALRIFDETDSDAASPRARAWVALQRGLLDIERGDRRWARRHFEKARALFPGFWQTEEHIAELDANEGRTERAIDAYRALVTKTNNPEFMDALARLVEKRDPAEAARLEERSNAIYRDRLARLPEATYGHALEHFLRMVPDPTQAVVIAEKNCALRPNGEARTRLAQAYLRADRLADARDEISNVVHSAWVSAESYATAAIVFERSGAPESKAMREKSLAINPYALDELEWLHARP